MWGSDSDRNDFDDWVAMWDKASMKMNGPAKAPEAGQDYFGLQSKRIPYKETPSEEESRVWRGLHADYAARIEPPRRDPKLIAEAEASGDTADYDRALKNPYDWRYRFQPNTFSTRGSDASPSDKEPVRVTPNFTDGERLRRLAELNELIHHLEAIHWRATTEGKYARAKKIGKELSAARKERDKMSNTLVPHPELDLA